jgi:hypothetical protein
VVYHCSARCSYNTVSRIDLPFLNVFKNVLSTTCVQMNEFRRMCKDMVMAYSKVLFQHFSGILMEIQSG